jgi:hypothetical protein
MWKKGAVAKFAILFQYLPGRSEKNYENPQSGGLWLEI